MPEQINDIKNGTTVEFGSNTVCFVDLKEKTFADLGCSFDLCPTDMKLKPTEFRSAFYHGYLYERASNKKMGLYRILPHIAPKNRTMIYSKNHLGDIDRDALKDHRGLYSRVYPFNELTTQASRSANIPQWVFSKNAIVKGLVALNNNNAQAVGYNLNNAKMVLLFYNRNTDPHSSPTRIFESNYTAGLGAFVDRVPYLNLGNSHLHCGYCKFGSATDEGMWAIMDTPSGGNCTGGLSEFLYKPDINARAANPELLFGWNGDLSRILNVSSIASIPPKAEVIKNIELQLPSFVGFTLRGRSFYNYQGSRVVVPFIPYRLVPLDAVDIIADQVTPWSIRHPVAKEAVLYSLGMYLCYRENDPTFNMLILSALSRMFNGNNKDSGRDNSMNTYSFIEKSFITYITVLDRYSKTIENSENFLDASKNGGLLKALIEQLSSNAVKDTIFVSLPISIYHTLFHKILHKIVFPEEFLTAINGDSIEDQECKKIAFVELCFQLFAYFHQILWRRYNEGLTSKAPFSRFFSVDILNDAQTKDYFENIVCQFYACNEDLKKIESFLRSVRPHITEELVDEAIRDTYDIALSISA